MSFFKINELPAYDPENQKLNVTSNHTRPSSVLPPKKSARKPENKHQELIEEDFEAF